MLELAVEDVGRCGSLEGFPVEVMSCLRSERDAVNIVAARQASLSMEFSRQEYWSGLPFPSPLDLLDPGIRPWSPTSQADSFIP